MALQNAKVGTIIHGIQQQLVYNVGNMKRLPYKTFHNMMQFSGNCFILLVRHSKFIMNMKKEVVENLKTYFQKELKAMDYEIWKNKNEIKRLVEKQSLLKRSRAKLDQLSRELS